MSTPEPRPSVQERARRGAEVYETRVRPALRPDAADKFVAVDMLTGEYELDAEELAAVTRLRGRLPGAEIWLGRVGHRAAHKLRGVR